MCTFSHGGGNEVDMMKRWMHLQSEWQRLLLAPSMKLWNWEDVGLDQEKREIGKDTDKLYQESGRKSKLKQERTETEF